MYYTSRIYVMKWFFFICVVTFRTHLFVNELIDIEPGKKHPLPWHSPTCQSPKSFNEKYITSTLLDATAQQQSSDASLKPFLHNLVQSADLAEIGQRILTAIETVRFLLLLLSRHSDYILIGNIDCVYVYMCVN